ncbi:MAG: peptidylprolyl isomerase [Bacteroidota bacterium]
MKRLFFLAALLCGILRAQDDSLIVASVGPYRISTADLLTSYEFGSAFVKRRSEPLREHLKYMIYERLLALEGLQNSKREVEFVKERINALEEDGAVEQLYRQEILSQVKLSDEQIANDTRKAKINVSLRWIYCHSKDEADLTSQSIGSGASFDSLYSVQFDSTMSSDSRMLETTLLKLERDNSELATALAALNTGSISLPVPGKDGYYIFRLDKAEQNPLITENEFTELKHQAVEIRKKLIADGLADEYVKNIMKQNDPVIKAEGFNILRAYLADRGLSRDTKVQWEIPSTFMTEAGPQPIRNSGNYLHRPLVTFGSRTMTIRDYAAWYDIRQFQFDTHSQEAFNSSVKRTIWKMVQDKLLSEEAYKRGLDKIPAVAHETKKWEAKLLYLSQRAAVLRTISATDSALQVFFRTNRKQYINEKGKPAEFQEVRELVKADYFTKEEAVVLLRTVEALRKKFSVSVNEQLLKRLSVATVRDPRAIEAVFYKPGGTFPRVAFPTIDEAWSTIQ